MVDISTYKKHIYDVIGAIHEVHKELGAGLNEYCYQEGLQMQFEEDGIPYKREFKESNDIVGVDGKVRQFL